MSGDAWTQEEMARLQDVWPRGRCRKAALEAQFPGRTWSGIVQKARLLGLKKPGYARWSRRDDDTLMRLYLKASQAQIEAELPSHSWHSIAKRAFEMGLKRDRAKRTASLDILRELRRIRRSRNLPVDRVGARCNVYGSTISAWETGLKVPNLRGFVEWVAALDLEIVLQRKGLAAVQAAPLVETPGVHRLMSRRASASAAIGAAGYQKPKVAA
jgi:transcriptional regulator with XRE-family HTH domain